MGRVVKRDARIGDAYLDLIKRFPLTSIRDDAHLRQAQEVLDSLFARGPFERGSQQYLEALSDLIEVYESQHIHFDEPSDAEVLSYLIQLRAITQATLAAETKIQKSTISEVISGKRRLTRQQIAKLARYFHVGQDAFAMSAD